MEKTGQLLKAERERQKLSINEISLSTKINPRILQAIEEGRKTDLPPKSFLRGFVRSYARYLNMDVDSILNSFQEEMGVTTPNPEDSVGETGKFPKKLPFLTDSSITAKTLVVFGILVLIGLIIGVKNIIQKYERERIVGEPPANVVSLKEKEESGLEEAMAPTEPAAPAGDTAEPTTAPVAVAPVVPSPEVKTTPPTPTPADGPAETPTPPAPGPAPVEKKVTAVETPKPTEIKPLPTVPAKTPTTAPAPDTSKPPVPPLQKPTVAATTPATPSVPATPPPASETVPEGPQEVILEALDKVSVSFRIDGAGAQKVDLQPGQIHIIKAKKSISLDADDGGVIDIVHNGRARGVPGDLGKPIKVKFP